MLFTIYCSIVHKSCQQTKNKLYSISAKHRKTEHILPSLMNHSKEQCKTNSLKEKSMSKIIRKTSYIL